MTQTIPSNPYSLDEMLYRQYMASLKPRDIVGTCKSASASAIATYLLKTYGKEFWVEDIEESHSAIYVPREGGEMQSLPEWARLEELVFDEMGYLGMIITKAAYDLKRTRHCAWCDEVSLLCEMGAVATEFDIETDKATTEVYVCNPCLEPLRQAQKEHDNSCEPTMPDEEFMHLTNGG